MAGGQHEARHTPQTPRVVARLGSAESAHKIHADGANVALRVGVISKAQQQAGLADARVADEDQLEDVIVLLRRASMNELSALQADSISASAAGPHRAECSPPEPFALAGGDIRDLRDAQTAQTAVSTLQEAGRRHAENRANRLTA